MPAASGPTKALSALPNTLGGKRAQARAIFRAVDEAGFPKGRGFTLVDPFMGGGSLSVIAKLLGYRVIAGDTSPRAQAVGDALITNSRVQLEPVDLAAVFGTDPKGWYLPAVKTLPWPENSRRLLAAFCKCAESYEDPSKRALLRMLMVKYASHVSIYGQPRMTAHQRIREKNWDALTDGQIARMLAPQTRPKEMAYRSAKAVYGAAFSNGYDNEFHRADVLDVIGSAAVAGRHDVLILDPPYPDTEGYGRNYVGIDSILEGREVSASESRFSSPDGWRELGPVLDAAEPFPLVILLLGAEKRHVGVDELTELMSARGRKVVARTLDYKLLGSRSTDKSERKREYVLIGTKGD